MTFILFYLLGALALALLVFRGARALGEKPEEFSPAVWAVLFLCSLLWPVMILWLVYDAYRDPIGRALGAVVKERSL